MPRIPTVERDTLPRTPAYRTALSQPTRAADRLSATMDQVTAFSLEQRDREIKREQRQSVYEAESEVSAALAEALSEFGDRNDYKVFPGEHDAFVQLRLDRIVDGIEDLDVADAVREFAGKQAARQSSGMRVRAAGLSQAATVAHLEEGIKQDAARFGLAQGDEGRAAVMGDVKRRLELARRTGDISEAEFVGQLSAFGSSGAKAYGRRIVNEDPDEAIRQLEDPENPILKVLDGETRESLIASAEAKSTERGLTASQLRTAKRLEAYRSVIEQIYSGGQLPTIDDITSNPLLSGGQIKTAVDLVQRKARGEIDRPANYALLADLTKRVWAPVDNPITNPVAEIWSYVGKGIGIEEARSLQTQWDASQKDKSASRIWGEALTTFRKSITGVSDMGVGPAVAEDRWRNYMILLEQKRAAKEAEGVSVLEMLSPDSPHYIVGQVPGPPTREEWRAHRNRLRERGRQAVKTGRGNPPRDSARQPGESGEEWSSRTGN